MLAVTFFAIYENSFTGMLPESVLIREVTAFSIHNNHFTGALPDGGVRSAMLPVSTFVELGNNYFEGSIKHACSIELQEQTKKRL
eukprot:3984387-Amphidinium_carterae.1